MNTNNTHAHLMRILTREGVLIHATVRYWRGRKKLAPEDLGLDRDKVSDRLVCLGHKRLLPRESLAGFALVEGRAHALIEANTFPFLGNIARFLPNNRLEDVRRGLAELQEDFEREKQTFLRGYDARRSEALTEWRHFAERTGADPDCLVAAVDEAFPSALRLERSFAFETRLFQIAVPESLRAEQSDFATHSAVVEARRNAAREASQKLRADTEAFVADCVATLRRETAKLCEEMLASINGVKCGVHQKTLNRLNRFIDQFKSLNFAGDEELEKQLETARRELLSRSAGEYRDDARARRELVGGLERLREHAGALARADATEVVRRFGEMGRRKFHFAA